MSEEATLGRVRSMRCATCDRSYMHKDTEANLKRALEGHLSDLEQAKAELSTLKYHIRELISLSN